MDGPREILRRRGLRPKRSWGQNFLSDENALAAICDALQPKDGEPIIELGGGLGHLTRRLCASGARVFVIERDRDMVEVLRAMNSPNLKVVEANAAKIDFAQVAGASPVGLVGNLPYHLSSSILFEVLDQHAHVNRAVFTLQKEVSERIAAGPGSREYGILSVLLGLFYEREYLRTLSSSLFFPPPGVDSSILRLTRFPAPRAPVSSLNHFKKVVKAGFSQRRKTLLNALGSNASIGSKPSIQKALAAAGIDPQRRAETLSPAEFAALETALIDLT